jgi:hypothetical protein
LLFKLRKLWGSEYLHDALSLAWSFLEISVRRDAGHHSTHAASRNMFSEADLQEDRAVIVIRHQAKFLSSVGALFLRPGLHHHRAPRGAAVKGSAQPRGATRSRPLCGEHGEHGEHWTLMATPRGATLDQFSKMKTIPLLKRGLMPRQRRNSTLAK